MLAVLVESGDVLELTFISLFFLCGNHNSNVYNFQPNYNASGWCLPFLPIITTFFHRSSFKVLHSRKKLSTLNRKKEIT